jgi:hypothetical protein
VLYLAQPTGALKWEDIPARTTLEAATKHGGDLARLDWKESTERQLTSDVLRVALRHGVACTAGIAFDAGYMHLLDHADEIRRTSTNAQQAHAMLERENQLREQLLPGSAEYGRQLNERIAESTANAIQEAEVAAAEVLAAAVDQALVEHWRSLGGRLPDPL